MDDTDRDACMACMGAWLLGMCPVEFDSGVTLAVHPSNAAAVITGGFTVWKWKHHCRFCGEVFCDSCCTSAYSLVPSDAAGVAVEGAAATSQRVCDICYTQL